MEESVTDRQATDRTARQFVTCEGRELRLLLQAGVAWLEAHHEYVNSLNVFPVPDGDTGTNMLLTMRAAYAEIAEDHSRHVGRIAEKIAHGALMGARGNSGVILSQIWRGFSRRIEEVPEFDAQQFAAAMREASNTAYKGVVKPVEGTILTVIRQAAEAAEIAVHSTVDLTEVLGRVVAQSHQAVAETPRLLKVLADAGVVDAGGEGLAIILEGMLRFLQGEPLDMTPGEFRPATLESVGAALDAVEPGQEWEVVLDFRPHRNLNLSAFYNHLEMMGTSIQLGEGKALYRLHIHLLKDRRYEPIDYVETLGTVVNVHMENLLDQLEQQTAAVARSTAGGPAMLLVEPQVVEPGKIAVIAIAPGEGIAGVLQSLGAAQIVSGGQTMNPSTEEILAAMESLNTDKVIVLPNNKNIIMAAQTACQFYSGEGRVVPTRTIPQGVSALLALDPDGDIDQVAEAMERCAGEVGTAEITIATRDVELDGVAVQSGHVLGLANGRICSAGPAMETVVRETLDKMGITDRELLTLYHGADTSADEADQMAELIQQWYPDLELEVVYGGQPHYYYIMSAE